MSLDPGMRKCKNLGMGPKLQMAKAMMAVLRVGQPSLPGDEAWEALEAGDLDHAEAHALEMLAAAEAPDVDGWPPDDRRHRAHTILGYVHLRRGDIDGAEGELLRSSEVEATPALGSFGPDLGLAWELLLAGRVDAVGEFAQRFSRFWSGPSAHGHL